MRRLLEIWHVNHSYINRTYCIEINSPRALLLCIPNIVISKVRSLRRLLLSRIFQGLFVDLANRTKAVPCSPADNKHVTGEMALSSKNHRVCGCSMFSGRSVQGKEKSSRLEAADATTSLAPAHLRPSTTRSSEVCDCDCVLVIPLPTAPRSGTTISSQLALDAL